MSLTKPHLLLLLLLLPLASTASPSVLQDEGRVQRVSGRRGDDSCLCSVNASVWSFPVHVYEAAQQRAEACRDALDAAEEQVQLAQSRLPQIQDQVQNVMDRLEPFQYLNDQGFYSSLSLRQLGQELSQLEVHINAVHGQMKSDQTRSLSREVKKLRQDVDQMQTTDNINMKTVKEKLRYLRNKAESCKSIPQDFRVQSRHCLRGLMVNISDPVVTKVSPFGKSFVSGSWGKQAMSDSPDQKESYWVQPLVNSHAWGNTVRVYETLPDFMSSTRHKDFIFAPSFSHADANEGPNAVLYGDALYYHCYRSTKICRYDLQTKTVARVTLPGLEVGFSNKFPYCYYDCRANSDIDLEADESGLWALYATTGNHGNLVMSRLEWYGEEKMLNVTHTWESRLFKKSVSNAFMACGVLYATRYLDKTREEVFYAFDTATGREDNTLSMRMEKIANGVSSLSYNPTDRHIYMYNEAYLLAYRTHF